MSGDSDTAGDGPRGGIYGGLTVTERRDQRRAKLLAAGMELIERGGWAAVSVRQVCAAAGLTARYFYESFASREELALALFDTLAMSAGQRVLAAVDAAPENALDKARAAVGAYAEMLEGEPTHAVVLFGHADGLPLLDARRLSMTHYFARLVQIRGRDFYGLAAKDEADVGSTMLAGGLAQVLLDWTSGRLAVSREAMVEQCALMFVGAGEAIVGYIRSTSD